MPTILGLTIGDDGFGFVVPTFGQTREALATTIRELRGIANLNTAPGSPFGDIIDLTTTALDLAFQAARQAVDRTIFTAMQGVALDQFLADYLTRLDATPSTALVYVYGSPGAAVALATSVRTAPLASTFTTDVAAVVPALPAESYAFEIAAFAAGAYVGQPFTVTVDGTPVVYVAGSNDDAFAVRNALVQAIALTLAVTQVPYRGGRSPTSGRYAGLVIEEQGGGPFPFAVAGPVGVIYGYPAVGIPVTCQVSGVVHAPPESLRYWSAPVGAEGVVNVDDAREGRARETDSQFKARHQVVQRGLGGGSPDAIKAVILSDPDVGGGGASFCTVEYNSSDVIDGAGNLPHSVRVVVDGDADGPTVARAGWRAKAAGDNTNGTELHLVPDLEGKLQEFYIDRLADVWVSVEVKVTPGDGWPNTGSPIDQLRQDITDYVEALQPTSNGSAVRVNLLPISTYPNGQARGVVNFEVRVGRGAAPGGPFIFEAWYPTPQPDAELASLILNGREKARCVIGDVSAVIF